MITGGYRRIPEDSLAWHSCDIEHLFKNLQLFTGNAALPKLAILLATHAASVFQIPRFSRRNSKNTRTFGNKHMLKQRSVCRMRIYIYISWIIMHYISHIDMYIHIYIYIVYLYIFVHTYIITLYYIYIYTYIYRYIFTQLYPHRIHRSPLATPGFAASAARAWHCCRPRRARARCARAAPWGRWSGAAPTPIGPALVRWCLGLEKTGVGKCPILGILDITL